MTLTADQRRAFARHLLLVELGEPGQERLCASRFAIADEADSRAAETARDYLLRAGVTEDPEGLRLALPGPDEIRRRSGSPGLEEAAAALAGAVAAVEAIKALAGVGRAGGLPTDWAVGPRE